MILQGILEQGLIYSLVVMALFISSRVIRFDDMTVEGSFGIGGALTAAGLLMGLPPWLMLPVVCAAGGASGLLTGLLHSRCGMSPLISGVCVTTALFSCALLLAGSNLSLTATIFTGLSPLILLLPLVVGLLLFLRWLLTTEAGLLLWATGESPQMVRDLSKRPETLRWMALALANSLTALAGSLWVQWAGFFSITANIGTLVIGLAGLFLAELVSRRMGFALLIGALAYQALFAGTLLLGLPPVWNNLIKAALIVLVIQFKKGEQRCFI